MKLFKKFFRRDNPKKTQQNSSTSEPGCSSSGHHNNPSILISDDDSVQPNNTSNSIFDSRVESSPEAIPQFLTIAEYPTNFEGEWKVYPDTIIINGVDQKASEEFDPNFVTLKICQLPEDNQFKIYLDVVNHISFHVKTSQFSWMNCGGARTTLMRCDQNHFRLEDGLLEMCLNPDEIRIDGKSGHMRITKGTSVAFFEKCEDTSL